MKLSKRDKFLIDEAFKVGETNHYTDSETWLGDLIDDVGHTVEDHLAFDADKIEEG